MSDEKPYPGSPEAIAARMKTESETSLMELAAADSASARHAEMELQRRRSAKSDRLICISIAVGALAILISVLQWISSC